MNRIDQKFKDLRKAKKKAFVAYLTAGDPSLKVTERLVKSLGNSGVDIIELGVPFSDPLADGPTIQAASQRALKNGVTLSKILNSVKHIRRSSDIPIALMTYYNPIFHYGEKEFVKKAVSAGVDGVIVPDLPPEEAKDLIRESKKAGLSTVFFLSPTTTKARMKTVSKASTGFIYYVSLTGVTGARNKLPASITSKVRLAKKYSKKPICVGFGVSSAKQVKKISRIADGVIVGSAIIKEIEKNSKKKDLVKKVSRFVAKISKGI